LAADEAASGKWKRIMCELLGMSARHPTDVNHSLALLRPRGGEIGRAAANRRLHRVRRSCRERECDQEVVVLTTTPLTDEAWSPVELGRFHVLAAGREVASG
jgi:predicted glutamine amidotransferase